MINLRISCQEMLAVLLVESSPYRNISSLDIKEFWLSPLKILALDYSRSYTERKELSIHHQGRDSKTLKFIISVFICSSA